MPPYDVLEVVTTLPADREHSFFCTLPDKELLEAELRGSSATLLVLLDPVGAPSLCAAACSNPSFRQRAVTTLALARKYGLGAPDISTRWRPYVSEEGLFLTSSSGCRGF
jgi:hypothetical protein